MSDELSMRDITYLDLESATDQLYVKAKRFVAVYEKEMTGHSHDEDGCTVTMGAVRWWLTQAAATADAAYDRAEKSGAFEAADDE